jgi:hypothetical protein
MFGLFKKQATPGEIGYGIDRYTAEFLSTDAGRSLGMRFEDYDASRGWSNFLERKGVSFRFKSCIFDFSYIVRSKPPALNSTRA